MADPFQAPQVPNVGGILALMAALSPRQEAKRNAFADVGAGIGAAGQGIARGMERRQGNELDVQRFLAELAARRSEGEDERAFRKTEYENLRTSRERIAGVRSQEKRDAEIANLGAMEAELVDKANAGEDVAARLNFIRQRRAALADPTATAAATDPGALKDELAKAVTTKTTAPAASMVVPPLGPHALGLPKQFAVGPPATPRAAAPPPPPTAPARPFDLPPLSQSHKRTFLGKILSDPGVRSRIGGSAGVNVSDPDHQFFADLVDAIRNNKATLTRDDIKAEALKDLKDDAEILRLAPGVAKGKRAMIRPKAGEGVRTADPLGPGSRLVRQFKTEGPFFYETSPADTVRAFPMFAPEVVFDFIDIVADRQGMK